MSSPAVPGVTSAQLPDLVAKPLGEPEVAIGPCRDAIRAAIRRRDRELGQFVIVSRADAPDVVATELSEPEVAIGPCRDASRLALGRRDRELGDHACRGDAPDLVDIVLGEPEVAIGPRRDANRPAIGRRDRKLADLAGKRQSAGSSKRQHADEQAQEPGEQGETQGDVTLFHTYTKPFCSVWPAVGQRGGEKENFHTRKATNEGCLGQYPGDRYMPHPLQMHRTRDEESEITSTNILPQSSLSKHPSATMFLGCQHRWPAVAPGPSDAPCPSQAPFSTQSPSLANTDTTLPEMEEQSCSS